MNCKKCHGGSPEAKACDQCSGEGVAVPQGDDLDRWALNHGWSIYLYTDRILSSREFLDPEEAFKFFDIDDQDGYRPVMARHYRAWWRAGQPRSDRPAGITARVRDWEAVRR